MLSHAKTTAKARRRHPNAKGFTLIELLVVIVILGILAAVVVFAVQRHHRPGRGVSACKTEGRTVTHRGRGLLRPERRRTRRTPPRSPPDRRTSSSTDTPKYWTVVRRRRDRPPLVSRHRDCPLILAHLSSATRPAPSGRAVRVRAGARGRRSATSPHRSPGGTQCSSARPGASPRRSSAATSSPRRRSRRPWPRPAAPASPWRTSSSASASRPQRPGLRPRRRRRRSRFVDLDEAVIHPDAVAAVPRRAGPQPTRCWA